MVIARALDVRCGKERENVVDRLGELPEGKPVRIVRRNILSLGRDKVRN